MLNLQSTRTGRRILFGSLYFSEGAPIGFIWWALPTRLRVEGVPVEEITALTSLLVLPWAFKFLWAPLVDTFRSSRWTFRSWIVTTQTLMGICLLPLLVLDMHNNFPAVVSLLLAHAFVAATQDASIDALCISTIPATERGDINGWMQAGMLTGRALFGGGALLLTESLEDHVVIALLVGVVWSSMALVILSKPGIVELTETVGISERWSEFSVRFKAMVKLKTTWFGVLFALFAAAGFEAVGAVAGPYMIDHELSKESVGVFFGVYVVLGMLSGALVGGYLSDRIGRRLSVAIFLLLFVVIIATLAATDVLLPDDLQWWIVGLFAVLYLSIGMFTASSYALFMDITNPRLGATQFSAYMGATNGCESWSTLAVGKLHASFGYPMAFGVMCGVSLLSLLMLGQIRPEEKN